jgi:hypothetical protein
VFCLLAFSLLNLNAAARDPSIETRVREFVQVARAGSAVSPKALPESFSLRSNAPHPDSPEIRVIEFSSDDGPVAGVIGIDAKGRVWGYDDQFRSDQTWSSDGALSVENLEALAKSYYTAAGFSDALVMFNVSPRHLGGGAFLMQFMPTHEGVPFHPRHEVAMWIDHRTGKLEHFLRRSPCEPPPSILPSIDEHTARARMLGHLFSLRPELGQVAENTPFQLLIWQPDAHGPYDYLSPELRELGQNNRGILAYRMVAVDLDRWNEAKGIGPSYTVFLDAASGRVLFVDAMEGGWGGSAEAPSGDPPSLAWDLGAGCLRIFAEGRSLAVRDASVELLDAAPATGEEIPVLLHREGRTVRASFDPAAGTLRMERGAERIGGRPNAALLEALRRLARDATED